MKPWMIDLIALIGLALIGYGLYLFSVQVMCLGLGGVVFVMAIFMAHNRAKSESNRE